MKKLITTYTFDASARTVELSDYGSDFDIKGLLLIVNVTDNIAIYNFAVDGLGHTGVADDVITLEHDTTSMADSDKLLVYYDDPAGTQLVDLGTNNDIKIASGQVASGAFASGSIASGAVSSGAIASGAIASGAIASGAIANGAIASGALVSGSVADGAMVTLGAKADAKNSATDTTSITAMQVLKQISYELQETISGTLADNTSNPDTTVHGSMIMGLEADGNWDRLKSTSGQLQITIPNLEHAEDSSHTSTDKGIMPLAVRNDTLAALAGTDGDYAPLQVNATGALFVTIDDGGGAITVDGTVAVTHDALTELGTAINASDQVDVNIASGGFDGAVTNAGLTELAAAINSSKVDVNISSGGFNGAVTNTGLTALDGAIHAEDAAHSSGNTGIMPLAVRNDTLAALGGADGDYSPLQVNSSGALYVSIDDGGNTITVDGTVTANLSATDNAVLDTIDSVLDTIKVDTEAIETAVEAIQVDAAAIEVLLAAANVDHAANEALLITIDSDTNAIKTAVEGTITVDGTVTANLSATDNAVLDTIDAVLDTIKVDTEAIETAVEAIQSGQLANGHNVVATSTVVPAGQATLTSYDQFTVETSVAALTHANHLNTTETAAKEIFIQADFDNSGFVMVGSSGTAATGTLKGIRLDAGDTLILAVADIADVFMDASAASQKALVTITK